MEQLLRTTDVKRIYVLIRGKKGSPAQERLQTILHSGLFHLVRDDRALLSKVCAVGLAHVRCPACTPSRPGQEDLRAHACGSCLLPVTVASLGGCCPVADSHAQVHLLEGDLNSDNLGLSPADQAKVFTEVQFVVHSAASIELEADVQHTLRSNYLGTRRLLTMATHMTALRCFLHVSTAYVNVNQPRGTYVEERIYPLR